MDADQVREVLRQHCAAAGGQKHAALAGGVSQAHLSEVINGIKEPGPAICRMLGLKIDFVPVVPPKRRRSTVGRKCV